MSPRVEKARLGFAPMQKLLKTLSLILLTTASATLSAAPVGYSINSDSATSEPDTLYTIDMSNGAVISKIGIIRLPPIPDQPIDRRQDVEGLAFAANGLLYGIDDEQLRLFGINPGSAVIDTNRDYLITGGGLTPRDNDFGMTFACDGDLYVTSVTNNALYRIDPGSGAASLVHPTNKLNTKISALAAYGEPVRLFGLSNGTAGAVPAVPPKLYEIDTTTGLATEIGQLGGSVGSYSEGGLSFDDAGQLWAITDRSLDSLPSQVMRINSSTGAASDVRNTTEQGFESLAIAPPRGCSTQGSDNSAAFIVQKRFEDQNNITPVKLNIKCNGGVPLENSLMVLPNQGDFGQTEVRFVVENFDDGNLSCEVWEETPAGYSAEYDCQSGSSCSTNTASGPCSFSSVGFGQEDLCLIQNRVNPVGITVSKQWVYDREDRVEDIIDDTVKVGLTCSSVFDGDGEPGGSGMMHWEWEFGGTSPGQMATVYPDFSGATRCWTDEAPKTSAVEPESTCVPPITIALGDTARNCTVTNTIFFEGIPTLNPYGLALISALMLLTGLISVRRTG